MNRKTSVSTSLPDNSLSRYLYYVQTLPGLEKIAWREITKKLPTATLLGYRTMGTKNSLVLFEYIDEPEALRELRTVEDIFYVVVQSTNLPPGRVGLDLLPNLIAGQIDWSHAMGTFHLVASSTPRSGNRRMTYRVISRIVGDQLIYRKEAQARVERAVRTDHPRWQLVDDNSDLELWLNIFGSEVLLGLRLTDKTMRHRSYKLEHLPASLRPTVAATLVLLSEPRAEDVFLDPMCGAATILIERALWGRYQQLLGGDLRHEAVDVALTNIGRKYKPIDVQQWDATNLSMLAPASIDCVVCNLPFGRQLGSRSENSRLYRLFLREMARILRVGGRMVLLTSDVQQLQEELQELGSTLKISERQPFLLLGVPAEIFVIRRLAA